MPAKSARSRIPTPVFENEVPKERNRQLLRPNSCGPVVDEEKISRFLSSHQVAELVEGKKTLSIGSGSPFKFSTIHIIDARYEYEYDGGHIKGIFF